MCSSCFPCGDFLEPPFFTASSSSMIYRMHLHDTLLPGGICTHPLYCMKCLAYMAKASFLREISMPHNASPACLSHPLYHVGMYPIESLCSHIAFFDWPSTSLFTMGRICHTTCCVWLCMEQWSHALCHISPFDISYGAHVCTNTRWDMMGTSRIATYRMMCQFFSVSQ